MMVQGRICSVSSVLLYIITCHFARAGPVIRPSRMVREIYPEVEQEIPDSTQSQACTVGLVSYPAGSPVPSTSPCVRCTCVSASVACTSKACSCVYQGRVFANGQRLPQRAGAECSVCYCRAGHVQCAEVGCYTRTDCEPTFVQGECCPKYDHCPPRDPLSDRILVTPSSLEPSLLTEDGSGDDDFLMSDEPRRPSTPVTFSIKEIESKTNSKRNDDKKIVVVDQASQTDPEARPQITIQEVIPPRTEFVPRDAVVISGLNPVTYKSQETILSSTESSNELTDIESYASEKTEVYDHPPPVLRIGDQLLFVKQGQLIPEKDASTPSPVITLIGAEGLQIGLGSGELIEQDILPVSPQDVSSTSESISVRTEGSTEESTELITDETVNITEETSSTTVSSSLSSSTVETEQSEYIPEENPYYPPIPEDIMNLGHDEITTDITVKMTKKTDKINSNGADEITVIPLSAKKVQEKILPDILELRINDTVAPNKTLASQEWLKQEEPTKISIPLINEKAALPDELLQMTAASDVTTDDDITTNTILPSTLADVSTDNYKNTDLPIYDKIVASPVENQKSKETLELDEEIFESGEFTTIVPVHSSLISSNEDASVELIQNDSTSIDTSDLVEMVPGFERVTEKHSEEELKTVDEISPKDDVEMINISGEKLVNDETSHVQMKDFHDEIQKRDVVKKVLKDTFDNPKENIQTDLTEDTTDSSVEISGQNDEQNLVKPNHDLLTRSLNTSKINAIKEDSPSVQTSTDKNLQVIQKVSTDTSKNVEESKETSDGSSLGVLRDFFKSQFRQYHNPKLAD